MLIQITNTQKDLSISSPSLRLAILAIFDFLKLQTDEISIQLVSQKKIGKLHDTLFKDPSPTDCISIPIDPPFTKTSPHILGEIFVCPKTALEYSQNHCCDPYEEVLLYVIHGILHLSGYDDIDLKDRKKMRKMEKKCLIFLKEKNIVLKPTRSF